MGSTGLARVRCANRRGLLRAFGFILRLTAPD
jgi:hypothetical protein